MSHCLAFCVQTWLFLGAKWILVLLHAVVLVRCSSRRVKPFNNLEQNRASLFKLHHCSAEAPVHGSRTLHVQGWINRTPDNCSIAPSRPLFEQSSFLIDFTQCDIVIPGDRSNDPRTLEDRD
jgi:hypothetical protein